MTQNLIQKLASQYKISIKSPEQLKNGNILMNIALKVLYSGTNQFIESKLSEAQGSTRSTSPLANSNKAGNNVIIINSLLKHIKSDNLIDKQTWVKELTFYNLLQNEQILLKFINWMIEVNKNSNPQTNHQAFNNYHQPQQQTLPMKNKNKSIKQNIYQEMTEEQINSMSSNRFRNMQVDNPRFKTEQHDQQNQFDNLYFASNLKNKPVEQPLIISPEKGDKIVRKGSFKLLKPKVTFTDDSINMRPKQISQTHKNHNSKHTNSQKQIQKMSNFYQPDELKEISMIQPSNHQLSSQNNITHHQNFYHDNSSQIFQPQDIPTKKTITQTPFISNKQSQVQNRKTIPKNLSKPPLSRSSSRKNKQNIQNGPSDKDKTVQQSLNKKNFFNFSHGQDTVSTFNYQLEPKNHITKQTLSNTNGQQENYESTSRSKVFSKIKDLSCNQVNQIRQQIAFESHGSNSNNIIEENDYTVSNGKNNQTEYLNINQDFIKPKPSHKPSESSSKMLKLKNHFLQKELYNLQKQINKQQSSIQQIQHFGPSSHNQPSNYESGHKRSATSFHYEQKQSALTSTSKNTSFDSTKKSNRKISKIQLDQLQEKQKYIVIDWLDSLHFVDKAKLTSHQDVFQKFKDGTKFVELCNYFIGRGKPMAYFSNPKKNAQIHSNYSKVFEYLKSYSQWEYPELLFAYELFVPYPQQSSVWNLLFGMFKLLTKKVKTVYKSASKDQSLICTKELESSRKLSVQKQFQLMQENSQKQESSKKPLDFNPQKNQQTSRKSNSASRKQSNFTKPIQFVRQIPENLKHNDLVQQDQQHESCNGSDKYLKQNEANMNVYFEGYKERFMRKTIQNSSSKSKSKCASLQTPKKSDNQPNPHQQSFIYPYGQSINKGSIRKSSSKKMLQNQIKKMENSSCKLLSAKKSQRQNKKTKLLPKISLNMQMKVEKIMKYFGLNKLIDDKNNQKLVKLQLLQDPIRNGTFINLLLGKFVRTLEGKYIQTVRSIEQCRQNYMNFYGLIKNKYGQEGFEMVEEYLDFTEDILKGEKTLFYGIAYSLIQLMQKKGFKMGEQLYQTKSTENKTLGTYRGQKQKIESMIELFVRNPIQWIRYLQRSNSKIVGQKIRTQEELMKSLSLGQSISIKPIYPNPCNIQERQANLKKIICYLVQNKIALDKEDFYNVRAIAQSSILVVKGLVGKLVRYSVEKYGVGDYRQNLNMFMSNNHENGSMVSNKIGMSQKLIGLGKYLQDNKNKQLENNSLKNYPQNNNNNQLQNNTNNYLQDNKNNYYKNANIRLQTTTAQYINQTQNHYNNKSHNQPQQKRFPKNFQQQTPTIDVQIPWLRKLGFTNCSLSINNGIMLCRLISKLTRTNIKFNENISTDASIPKPQSLGYIRKAIKLIPSFKYDQIDIYEADSATTLQVYDLIKEKFRNTYQMTKILSTK